MTRYPNLIFRGEPAGDEKTRWSVYFEGHLLGSVYSLYSGGWANKFGPGYATRYEAAYSLYTAVGREAKGPDG